MDEPTTPSPTPRPHPGPAADAAEETAAASATGADDGVGDAEPGGTTRRWILAGGAALGALVVGAGVGAIVADGHRRTAKPVPNPPPGTLVAAATLERGLIADLDATTGGSPAVRQLVAAARADHTAHLAAVEELLRRYDPLPGAAPSSTGPSTAPTPGLPVAATSTASAAPSGPSSGPSSGNETLPTGRPRTLAQLAAAERRAAGRYEQLAATGSGNLAVLFASVSAAESCHAELFG